MTHALNMEGYAQVFKNLATDVYDPEESIWEVEFKGNRQDSHTNAGRIVFRMRMYFRLLWDIAMAGIV